jgi:hypothetical protein
MSSANNALINTSDRSSKSQNMLDQGFIMDQSTTSTSGESKRCQSDSSTTSTDNKEGLRSRFNSVDNGMPSKKVNNLLKLSLMNSPNSPRKIQSSSMNGSSSLVDSVFLNSKKLGNRSDVSFEDLNNVSEKLIDSSNISLSDEDLKQLRISFLENNPLSPKVESPTKKMNNIQETLKRIKIEKVDDSDNVEVKEEVVSPNRSNQIELSQKENSNATKLDVDVDDILLAIKNHVKGNNKDEAKKHLLKLNELLTDSPKTLQVQPMVRQDTFDIDPKTGKRKYTGKCKDGDGDNNNGDLMEQISKLLESHNVDVSSLNLSNGTGGGAETKLVVIMPKMPSPQGAITPVKQSNSARRSVSMSVTQKPQSALKAIENKKLSTPMKHSLATSATVSRRSSFTAPRSLSKPSNSYDQKLNMGAVRKSLMPSMDKTPIKNGGDKISPPSRNSNVTIRRSVSLKSAVPSVKLTEATPTKSSRLVTTAPTPSKLSQNVNAKTSSTSANKRLSSLNPQRPITARVTATNTKPTTNRPITKTDFKTPYGIAKKTSPSTFGSLV